MWACGSCGRENPDDSSFCGGCGAARAPSAPSREERKVVSVVFADLVGSTAQAERSDPEDVRAMLAAHHARVRAELERFGGTVEKFIGDAVVAVFGAPVAHEDDPERAVRAALSIRDVAADAGVELRVAVNTGEALVTLDARPADGEGMVAGDVVNTAARIQSAAPVNGVLVGQTTHRATSHVIEYRDVNPIAAKGKAEPVAVWEAVAPRSRFGSDVEEAPLAALVGREREMEQLRAGLARALEKREPQLVTLVGVPGIGKSRLVAELLRIVEEAPELITWRQGRCLPYGEGISYWALGEMAKAQAGVFEADSAEEAGQKLADAVEALVADPSEAAWVVGHLRPLLGLGAEIQSSGESRGETFAAWRRFFEGLGEQRPTVLVFEDLHWADEGLLDFVDGMVDRATGVPLLVLCSARPELLTRRPGWGGGKANAVTLSLSALSDGDTARLIADHLAQAVLPAELQQTLLRRADGNPLFAEEYIRMLKDRGLLRRDGDTWRLESAGVEVPETVQGIIAARLDALGQDEKDVLQAAAVVGKVFWLGSVVAIAGISEWEAEQRLHTLERKELVRRDRRASVAGETEYSVRHVLVRDVAYGQIPRARRAELHTQAAAWIDSLAVERAEDRAEMLAHHYLAALELTRAAGGDTRELEGPARQALRDAGDRAFALSAIDAAVHYYRESLELTGPDDPTRARTLLRLGTTLTLRVEGEEELEEAAAALLAAGDLAGAGEAESCLGELRWMQGAQVQARAHYDRALELIEGQPETAATATARMWRWRALLIANESPSLEEGERLVELAESVAPIDVALNARVTLGIGHFMAGNTTQGQELMRAALDDSLRAKSYVAARAALNVASQLGTIGDLPGSAEMHLEAAEIALRFAGGHHYHWLVAETILDDYLGGRWDRALQESRAFVEMDDDRHYYLAMVLAALTPILAARGDATQAREHDAAHVRLAREIGDPQVLWSALGLSAQVSIAAGDRATAAERLDELSGLMAAAASFPVEITFVDGFAAADSLGRGAELASYLERASFPSPWVDACAMICAGDLDGAGDLLESRHAHAHAALVRLRAAERAGRETPGLPKAVAFYERVRATAHLGRAERLLQASA